MSIKVLLYTRCPEYFNEMNNTDCEFTRVPAVGEYFEIRSGDDFYLNYLFKVVLVVHIPLIPSSTDPPYKYSAEVYAIRMKRSDAIQFSDFYDSSAYLPDF